MEALTRYAQLAELRKEHQFLLLRTQYVSGAWTRLDSGNDRCGRNTGIARMQEQDSRCIG
ncbi:hypothetical protein ALC57_09294 [Trachymyrmex cornetzi]|uniref:Uncharacterized protein n=1 Tax=Trachymyrmex cornetzi TaxID=471704 RepID=A0A151J601_9HYME|nr:hypothetical protein ALC57_09294 [Trachymyrmex cornetzi]